MAPQNLKHRRTHNLLLISKLLNQRESASPFTLVIDSLEQSGKPLIQEYIRRASTAKNQIIFISFETLRKPRNVDLFIPAWQEADFAVIQKQILAQLSSSGSIPPQQRKLIIFDSLNTLSSSPTHSQSLPHLLSSFITPTTSLVALYHADIPLSHPSLTAGPATHNTYAPPPLTILRYLATTIMTTHSLHHMLQQKAARERSVAAPVFGLEEEVPGVLIGMGSNGQSTMTMTKTSSGGEASTAGLVMEVEYRRKSGRGVREWYFLPSTSSSFSSSSSTSSSTTTTTASRGPGNSREPVILLEDHVLYRAPPSTDSSGGGGGSNNESESLDVTFELGLTEKQRRDREGVVLPYFDAQKGGGGEGGRILYDMGVEDDFDEEEDEI